MIKTSEEASDETSEKTSEKILRLIKKNPKITASELAVEVGISQRAVELSIRKMRDAGVMRRKGLDTGGTWEVVKR